mmetsp:Transcript_11415/g.18581  ORF Transcript_11415/g.18581 Transcript_11415/m.18581 type:complete len:223 (+) Transcript_11415:152-820(+)
MNRLKSLWTKYSAPLSTAEVLSRHQLDSVARNAPLIEIKHRIGKSTQKFELQNWYTRPGSCVGRYVSNGYGSPAGAYSWGIWVNGHKGGTGALQNIGAYRMHDSHGNLLAYRLDILKDVVIDCEGVAASDIENRIEFSDLVVDCWLWADEQGAVSPQGRDVTVEDQEELLRLQEAGVLGPADVAVVHDTLSRLLAAPQMVSAAIDDMIAEAVAKVERRSPAS